MKDFHHDDKYNTNGCLGEDEDVVLMETEDMPSTTWTIKLKTMTLNINIHTMEYLTVCREKLMSKVRKYRAVVEDQKSQMIKMQQKQHKEIERIRTF